MYLYIYINISITLFYYLYIPIYFIILRETGSGHYILFHKARYLTGRGTLWKKGKNSICLDYCTLIQEIH